MKKFTTQQEILLVTGSSFSTRIWCKNDESGPSSPQTPTERLQEACWNGLILELLPEISKRPGESKKLFLWQIREGESILELDLSECPTEKDPDSSIDPYLFTSIVCHN
jgi:hypothetical protein